VYAYANIRWNRRASELLYYVVEPEISQYDLDVIDKTKKLLEEKLDIDFFKLGEIKAKDLLREEVQRILGLNPNLDPEKVDSIRYYLERDIVGMGKIEPLMNDPNIEDISCDGVNIPIYVYHRNPDIGSLKTNVTFRSSDELNSFVVKIAQRCKKSISIAEPLLDAALPDGSRIQATLETDIARRGSNFTIRKFAEQPLTPSHMLRYGTLDSTQLAYLWLAIDNGQSILISGGTATGKTSLLNALSLFIRPTLKIVSIEDTPELRLPHPHWIPEVARTPLSIKGSVGDVSLFDLLKSSLRQRPDYIVMGEVRGKEAFVLFQQMATGHPSLATIHAASINQLVDRLTTPPISLPPSLIENINTIVFLSLSRHSGRYIRRA
ncbi:MAG: type II/IV secretion system ATPase subunit, partial [Candidatus Aenigmarchaeota archaeon]|nr:type II/IV secretion system ATPase subunit [Candidatus Aenigmarchaeota archaeon]